MDEIIQLLAGKVAELAGTVDDEILSEVNRRILIFANKCTLDTVDVMFKSELYWATKNHYRLRKEKLGDEALWSKQTSPQLGPEDQAVFNEMLKGVERRRKLYEGVDNDQSTWSRSIMEQKETVVRLYDKCH